MKETLGQNLREKREKKKISINSIIVEAGLKFEQIKAIEQGSTNYTIDSLIKYMYCLGLGLETRENKILS